MQKYVTTKLYSRCSWWRELENGCRVAVQHVGWIIFVGGGVDWLELLISFELIIDMSSVCQFLSSLSYFYCSEMNGLNAEAVMVMKQNTWYIWQCMLPKIQKASSLQWSIFVNDKCVTERSFCHRMTYWFYHSGSFPIANVQWRSKKQSDKQANTYKPAEIGFVHIIHFKRQVNCQKMSRGFFFKCI